LTDDSIARAARRFDMDGATAVDVLGGFRERGILLADAEGTLRFRVPVFGRWLVDEGVGEIVVTMGDDDAIIRRQRAQEALRPKAEELEELDTRWRTYAGQLITAERIRRWLGQFGGPGDQRLMLKLLQGLRYYRPDDVRERLRRLQQFVLRDLASAGYEYRLEGRLATYSFVRWRVAVAAPPICSSPFGTRTASMRSASLTLMLCRSA
jgi:hypothetical protein